MNLYNKDVNSSWLQPIWMSDLQNEIFLFAGNGFVYNYCNN